jgi:hypothetical protein
LFAIIVSAAEGLEQGRERVEPGSSALSRRPARRTLVNVSLGGSAGAASSLALAPRRRPGRKAISKKHQSAGRP